MANNRKEYRTDLVIGGKETPQLKQATNNACKYLQQISTAAKMSVFGLGAKVITSVVGNTVNYVKSNFKTWIDAASDLIETQSKVEQVFKNSSNSVFNWAKTSTSSMGLAQQTALDTAALFGDMATSMGINSQQAAQMSMRLTQLGADLASFKNMSSEQTTNALSGIFTGQSLALTNLGVVMNEANLLEYAHSIGIRKKMKDMTQAEKVMLRYRFVLDRTKNSHGDYLKTLQGAANQQRSFGESIKNLQADLGMEVLPYYTKILQTANKFLQEHSDEIVSGFTKAIQVAQGFYKFISNVVKFVSNNAIPILAGLGSVIGTIVTVGTIDLIKHLGQSIMIASAEGLIATNNFGRYLMIMKGIPGVISLWAKETWAAVWANRALRYAIMGTGVGLLVIALTEIIIHWKDICEWTKKAIEATKKFFHIKSNGDKNQTPQSNVQQHNALGSRYFVGGSTWVGENGPEIVNLPRGSEILSHNKSTQGAIAGVNLNCTFNMSFAGSADSNTVQGAINSTMPSIKSQIDAYFRQKQRLGYSF